MWDETLAEGLGVQQVRAGGTEPADSDDAPGSVFVSLKATSWTASFIYPFFFFLVMILKQERTKKKYLSSLLVCFQTEQRRGIFLFDVTPRRRSFKVRRAILAPGGRLAGPAGLGVRTRGGEERGATGT